jgi:hypothetical protein
MLKEYVYFNECEDCPNFHEPTFKCTELNKTAAEYGVLNNCPLKIDDKELVYVVTTGEYADYEIIGIFKTEKLAKECIKELLKEDDIYDGSSTYYKIYELNKKCK